MQDIRLRTGSATILSLVAFTGIPGAAGVFIWWLLFSRPRSVLRRMRIVYPAMILILFFGLILEITGGAGISYAIRMLVIVLIGAWMYSQYRPGDFLSLGTWLLGRKTGFDLGMIAEMGIQSLDLMVADFSRIRLAYEVKGTRWGIRTLAPGAGILIKSALRRAEDTTEILAARGYVRGGVPARCSGQRHGISPAVSPHYAWESFRSFPLVNFLYFTIEFLRCWMDSRHSDEAPPWIP